MTLIETGTINNFVRQDNPSARDLEKAFNQRIKKHMKKHYDDYICLSPIQKTNEHFVFEIRDARGQFTHTYRMVFQNPDYYYKNHMGSNVQVCSTPFELFLEN